MKENMVTETQKTQPVKQDEAKHNPYETFREVVKATVMATVVRVRDTSISFNWSLGKVITACAEACKLPVQVPDDFKKIVKFEFGKMRDVVANDPDYELARSRQDYILNNGQMKARLTNVSLKIIALEEQLNEARKAYSRLGVKSTDESLSAEKRSSIRKKLNNYVVVMDHVSAEIERQKKLQAEAQVVVK